jgi:hypothetical protein
MKTRRNKRKILRVGDNYVKGVSDGRGKKET